MITLGIEAVSVDPAFDTGPQHANQNDVERELSALTAEPDPVNGLATRAPTVDRSPGTSPAVGAHHLNATRAPQSADVPRIGPGPFAMRTKRWFDLVVATLMLLPVCLLAALIAMLIKLTSRGPVLFRQVRVGLEGEHFEIFKFRTMVRDADSRKAHLLAHSEADGLFKIRQDPRLTRIGALLRATYLDELPQLINVFRGEMSLVGPRPLVPAEDAAIKGSGRARLQVPPGMTGEWQLLRGGGASLDELIAMDYRYVAGWSLWRDVRCVAKTAQRMLGSAGW